MAQHRREYKAPGSPDEGLIADRSYHQGADKFTFGFITNAYQLRELVKSSTAYVIDSNDNDPSGSYDLRSKGSKPNQVDYRKPKATLDASDAIESRSGEAKPKISTWLQGRNTGRSRIIKFTFTTDKSKSLLRQFKTESYRNRPLTLDVNGCEPNFTDISLTHLQDRYLRERKTSCRQDHESEVSDIVDETLNHPAARGCVSCVRLGIKCPLLDEGSTYPCAHCKEATDDCILINPPKLKASCQHCKRRRVVCSYFKNNENHDAFCENCQKENTKCLAGPKTGRMRQGPSYDQESGHLVNPFALSGTTALEAISGFEKTPKPVKTAVKRGKSSKIPMNTGNGVRTKGRITKAKYSKRSQGCTSLQLLQNAFDQLSRAQSGDSNAVTMDGKPIKSSGPNLAYSEPLLIPSINVIPGLGETDSLATRFGTNLQEVQHHALATTKSYPRALNETTHPQGNGLTSTLSTVSQEQTTEITTYFPHPIYLNHDFKNGQSCKFCANEAFAITGYGRTAVRVRSNGPISPYFQVDNEPLASLGPTFMCRACTMSRTNISMCEGHDLILVEGGMTSAEAEAIEYLQYLAAGPGVEIPFEWCSLCISPAMVGCASCPESFADECLMEGCGLRLCELCASDFLHACAGNLDTLVEMVKQRDNSSWWTTRADLEFLHMSGHMMTRVMADMMR